jgi:Protein of unknown function (DUF3592)
VIACHHLCGSPRVQELRARWQLLGGFRKLIAILWSGILKAIGYCLAAVMCVGFIAAFLAFPGTGVYLLVMSVQNIQAAVRKRALQEAVRSSWLPVNATMTAVTRKTGTGCSLDDAASSSSAPPAAPASPSPVNRRKLAATTPGRPLQSSHFLARRQQGRRLAGVDGCTPGTVHWTAGTYTYRYHGQHYTSSMLKITSTRGDANVYKSLHAAFEYSMPVHAWVDPAHPERATLARNHLDWHHDAAAGAWAGIFGFCFDVVFILLPITWLICLCCSQLCRKSASSKPQSDRRTNPAVVRRSSMPEQRSAALALPERLRSLVCCCCSAATARPAPEGSMRSFGGGTIEESAQSWWRAARNNAANPALAAPGFANSNLLNHSHGDSSSVSNVIMHANGAFSSASPPSSPVQQPGVAASFVYFFGDKFATGHTSTVGAEGSRLPRLSLARRAAQGRPSGRPGLGDVACAQKARTPACS